MGSFLSSIFGDQQLTDIDKQIETIINTINVRDFATDTTDTDASELIHQLLSVDDKFTNKDALKKNPFFKDFTDKTGIMGEVGTLLDKLTVQPERASRYKTYEEIYSTIPMIKKMLKTWMANLVQKNPVSGKSLMVKDIDEDNENIDIQSEEFQNKKSAARIFVDEVLDYYEIVEKLKTRILPIQQIYGDCFVELVNLEDFSLTDEEQNGDDLGSYFLGESSLTGGKVDLPQKKSFKSDKEKIDRLLEKTSGEFKLEDVCQDLADIFIETDYNEKDIFLSESLADIRKNKEIVIKERTNNKVLDSHEFFYEYLQNNAGELKPFLKLRTVTENNITKSKNRGRPRKKPLNEELSTFDEKMAKIGLRQSVDMSKILLMIHQPKNIVILHTSYGSKLGYVEVADRENIQSTNITQQLSTIIGRIVSVSNNGTNSQEEIISRIVRTIIKSIIEQSASKRKGTGNNRKDIEAVLNSLAPEVHNTIKKLVIETDKDNPKRNTFRKLKARFIPVSRMFQFTVPSSEYYPYGLSFIDPLVLNAKMYILSQLSNIIMKLSRAAPIRKWIVDVGATQGQTKYVGSWTY